MLQTAHELVLAELLFNGTLKGLSEVQLASLLSCAVWGEAAEGSAKVREDMEAPFAALREAARLVGRVQSESGMALDAEGLVTSFRPDLMDPVMLWATGSTFLQVRPRGGGLSGVNARSCCSVLQRRALGACCRSHRRPPQRARATQRTLLPRWLPTRPLYSLQHADSPHRAQVAKTTTIFEGSLVRAIRRLDELLQQLATACRLIGDTDLAARFEGASGRIHRDVIFAASLYL